MPNPPFTDIHCHPDLKTFLSANEERNRIDSWQNVNVPHLLEIIDRILLGNILESQSSLTQLNNSLGTLGLVGLYAIEKSMIKGDLFRILGIHVNLLTVARILELMGHNNGINYELLKRISSRQTHYFSLFKEMQTHLVNSKNLAPGYKLLNKIDEYDPTKLNLIFTIEGGHNLFNRTCGCHVKRDVLANLDKLKTDGYTYLFMSIAHLERNRLATHAYGMKILHHRKFLPVGRGITNLGKEVIKEALSKPKRILIDIKHMSYEARKQYFNILETEYRSEKIPILISHGGVTGVSYQNMPRFKCKCCCRWSKVQYHEQPSGLMGTKFNPWSINLYDEEIKKIVDSEGLIGLNLDERILGTKQKKPSELIEYFSRKEFSCCRHRGQPVAQNLLQQPVGALLEREQIVNKIKIKLIDYLQKIIRNPDRISDFDNLYNEIDAMYNQLTSMPVVVTDDGIKHLCNNILHIVRIAGEGAWERICIGSDFDGLVNAIDNCRNTTEFSNLTRGLKHWLPLMAASDPRWNPITNIDQKVENIMSGNAYKFLKRNFI